MYTAVRFKGISQNYVGYYKNNIFNIQLGYMETEAHTKNEIVSHKLNKKIKRIRTVYFVY